MIESYIYCLIIIMILGSLLVGIMGFLAILRMFDTPRKKEKNKDYWKKNY